MKKGAVNIQSSHVAALIACESCVRGFRRVRGIHIGSQRLGMIPDTPCARVFATHGGQMTDDNTKPWMAYVDGAPLRNTRGFARRFGSSESAYRAARSAAPKRWHE